MTKKIVNINVSLAQASQLANHAQDANNIEVDVNSPTDVDSTVIGDMVIDAVRKLDRLGLESFALIVRFNYRDTANE